MDAARGACGVGGAGGVASLVAPAQVMMALNCCMMTCLMMSRGPAVETKLYNNITR